MERQPVSSYDRHTIAAVGELPVIVDEADLNGFWSLCTGPFGCLDYELRGGSLTVHGLNMVGGNEDFAFRGRCRLDQGSLSATLHFKRHGQGGDDGTIFGPADADFHVHFMAEAISPHHFEGCFRRLGFADLRIVMKRIGRQNIGPLQI